jgi:hypothetical protein
MTASRAPYEAEVDLTLAEYNETYLLCRDIGHAWRIRGHFRSPSGRGPVRRALECTRCGMGRTDEPDGYRTWHTYDQPDGYRVEGRRLTKAEVRAEGFRRAKVYSSEAVMLQALARSRRHLSSV